MTHTPSLRRTNGSADAPLTLLLAHGAGAGMDSPFLEAMATGLAARGWRVVRFEFPYMAQMRLSGQRRAPDRLPRLLEAFREQLALEQARPLLIGGKSMGGRVASLLAAELQAGGPVRGCLCLGYPFHPPGKPDQLRIAHLQALANPTLILQGERDPFGRREEVEGYALSPAVKVAWLQAGDHSFKPSRSAGITESQNWTVAVERADQWGRELLEAPPAPAGTG